MNKEDIKLVEIDLRFNDFVFEVKGETAQELMKEYMEQSLCAVTHIYWNEEEELLGIKKQMPFNTYVQTIPYREDIVNLLKEKMRIDKGKV